MCFCLRLCLCLRAPRICVRAHAQRVAYHRTSPTSGLVYFPHFFAVISTLLLLCGLLGGARVYTDHQPRATTLLTCWVVADVFSMASIDLGQFTLSCPIISRYIIFTTHTTISLAKFVMQDTPNVEKYGLLERAVLSLVGGLLLGW